MTPEEIAAFPREWTEWPSRRGDYPRCQECGTEVRPYMRAVDNADRGFPVEFQQATACPNGCTKEDGRRGMPGEDEQRG